MTSPIRMWSRLIQATFAFILCAGKVLAADMPVQVGQIDLQWRVDLVRVTEDGKFLAVQMANSQGGEEVRIFDVSDLSHPRFYSSVSIEAAGPMALAADGKALLAVNQLQAQTFSQPGTFRLTAYDVHDPSHPTRKWQREITGKDPSLAPDASAYAYVSSAKDSSERAELIVSKNGAKDGEIHVPLDFYSYSRGLHLSKLGNFVTYGPLTVMDLRQKTPVIYAQQGERDYLGQEDCVSALFENGQFLASDSRFHEFGLFEPTLGLPRIARLKNENLAAENFCFEPLAQAGNTLLFGDARGWVHRIDRIPSHRIALINKWYWPVAHSTSAMDSAGHVFLPKSQNNQEVVAIYDLNRSEQVPMDWARLESAWQAALTIYRDKRLSEYERAGNALRKFEEGLPSLAIDAAVKDVSDKTAAAILNDYAFLSSKQKRASDDEIDAAYRRAITLDPTRAVAHLNFADHLQSELPEFSDWDAKRHRIDEAVNNYRQYLDLGGMHTAAIDTFLRLANEPPEFDICHAIANYANVGKLKMLISATGSDVPMGDKKVDLWFTYEGSSHTPAMYAFDTDTNIPVEFPRDTEPGGDSLWGGDSLGLVVYRGERHVLSYKDMHHPMESKELSGGSRCVFKSATVESMASHPLEPELCKRLHSGNGPNTMELRGPASMDQHEVSEKYGTWTVMAGTGKVDVANDGHPINLGLFSLSSGAGPGCDEEFFDQVNAGGTAFISSPTQDKLMELQRAVIQGFYPVICGNSPRFFGYEGKTYYESKPAAWPPISDRNQYHWISRINHGKVEEVCGFGFTTTISVQEGGSVGE